MLLKRNPITTLISLPDADFSEVSIWGEGD